LTLNAGLPRVLTPNPAHSVAACGEASRA
jgi:hypothetical protein